MKTAQLLLPAVLLTGCQSFEARSTLQRVHRIAYPTTPERIIEVAQCKSLLHRTLYADRFSVIPGAARYEWHVINARYDLVIHTDSTTGFKVMSTDDVWIERRKNGFMSPGGTDNQQVVSDE